MADPEVNILLKAKDLTKGVFGGVGSALAGIGKMALGAAVGGIAAAAGAMVGGVKAATDWGEQLDNLQDLLGTTAKESSGLAVMANRIGLSSDELGQSLSIMTRGLLDVEGQAGPSAKAMGELGISIYDANGQIKDAPSLLQEVADVLGNMPDGLAKSSAMMDIFGRSGVQMGDLLAAAANGGVTAFQTEAEKLGLSFSQEKIDNIIEFGKQTEFLKSAFQGVAAQVGNVLLPVLSGFLEQSVLPFVTKYAPIWAAWIGENLPKALQVLSDFWNNVLKPAVMAVWEWMNTVLMPFLIDTVFPWLQTNIPKALQFLSNVWTNVLKPAITAVWNWLSTVLIPFLRDTVKPWLDKNIPAAIQTLSDFWNNTLLPAITAVWEFIDTYLMPIFETVKEILSIGLKLALEALAGIWENVLLPALEKVWEFVTTYITPALTWLMDKVVTPLANALNTGLRNALRWVNEQLQKLKDMLDKIHLPDWLTPGSPTPFELGLRGITDAMLDLNRMALPGLTMGLSPATLGARGMSAQTASQRLTVYGGLHLHGVENSQDLLASLSNLMIG